GRVVLVNDRMSLIETIDIAFGGDDILLAGPGNNVMLGGIGADNFRGSLSKDVMVGDFAAIYIQPESGRIINLTRFGQGGNTPDLITRAMEDLFSWNGNFGDWSRPVFGALTTRWGADSYLNADVHDLIDRIRLGAARPDIVIDRDGGGLSDYASSATAGEVSMRTDQTVQDGGQGYAGGTPPVDPSDEQAPQADAQPVASLPDAEPADRRADGLADPSPAAAVPESGASAAERVAMAAGVGLLGLSGALGTSGNGTVVFNSKTNTWEPKAGRKRGLSVRREAPQLTEIGSEDE
ncbi:MAG: hypothetical protein ACN6PE_20480, partial [Achromobacter marplatensis]|uniref:hypothetical protein n=1 Tax=Achromobacter marplatensis TaxID=470868 RepID=UPI003D0541BE